MSVTVRFINGTAANLPLTNYNPGPGWGPPPPAMLSAHALIPDAFFATNSTTALTISYAGAGGAHNAAYLPNPPTIHVTPANMAGALVVDGAGNVTVTLTYF